jgi:hypothetical protein
MAGGAVSDKPDLQTDWQAVVLSSMTPLAIAGGFIYAALTISWTPSADWVWGLVALVPLEFVRSLVMSTLGDAFKDYQNSAHALHKFLVSLASMAVIGIVWSMFNLGIGVPFALLANPRFQHLLAIPVLVLVAEYAVTLYLFHGDPRREGARIQAAADDTFDWIFMTVFSLPLPLIFLAIGYCWIKYGNAIAAWADSPDPSTHKDAVSLWLDNPDPIVFVPAVLCYGAWYFCIKAFLLARVHSAQFSRTGQRLLSAGWAGVLMWRGQVARDSDAQEEAEKVRERQAALAGEPVNAPTPTRQPRPRRQERGASL